MPDEGRVVEVATRFRLVADPTRLRILAALVQGESDVTCLGELSGAGLPAVSQHLAKLRLAGVVTARREGQRVVYELIDGGIRELVQAQLGSAAALGTSGR